MLLVYGMPSRRDGRTEGRVEQVLGTMRADSGVSSSLWGERSRCYCRRRCCWWWVEEGSKAAKGKVIIAPSMQGDLEEQACGTCQPSVGCDGCHHGGDIRRNEQPGTDRFLTCTYARLKWIDWIVLPRSASSSVSRRLPVSDCARPWLMIITGSLTYLCTWS